MTKIVKNKVKLMRQSWEKINETKLFQSSRKYQLFILIKLWTNIEFNRKNCTCDLLARFFGSVFRISVNFDYSYYELIELTKRR